MSGKPPGGPRRAATPGRLPAAGLAGRGPAWMSLGTPAEKATSFWPSTRRLLARLTPHRLVLTLVVVLSLSSVGLSEIGRAHV